MMCLLLFVFFVRSSEESRIQWTDECRKVSALPGEKQLRQEKQIWSAEKKDMASKTKRKPPSAWAV